MHIECRSWALVKNAITSLYSAPLVRGFLKISDSVMRCRSTIGSLTYSLCLLIGCTTSRLRRFQGGHTLANKADIQHSSIICFYHHDSSHNQLLNSHALFAKPAICLPLTSELHSDFVCLVWKLMFSNKWPKYRSLRFQQ